MFSYKIINKPKDFKINKTIVESIFFHISENIKKPQNWILNLIFLDDEEIKILNRQYRDKDYSTDVLSFHYFEDFSNLSKKEIAGEIILSESKIRSQSQIYQNTKEEEFYKLLIHSILHILGFDHETDKDFEAMNLEEQEIINLIFSNFEIKIN